MKDQSLYQTPCMSDSLFQISITQCSFTDKGRAFLTHWHEHFEFLYITKGEGIIECQRNKIEVKPGDVVVINSGELHSGCNTSSLLEYYCIIIDPAILQSSLSGICEVKYITPITQNLIMFQNKISDNSQISSCIANIIKENENKTVGYELSIKSLIYQALTILLRSYVKCTFSSRDYEKSKRELERLRLVLDYIEVHYREKIQLETLARMLNISSYHFCHLFKKLTNFTVTDYINCLRIEKAAELMNTNNMNITEIALEVGFNDINYFSRVFRKYKSMSPSDYKKLNNI